MNLPVTTSNRIKTMTQKDIDRVRVLEAEALKLPQIEIEIIQTLHAGVYSRTAILPACAFITGAEIRIQTTLFISGNVKAFVGHEVRDYVGYHVVEADAGRKQAFYAIEPSVLTMVFKTDAATVEEAEEEFTCEVDILTTRRKEPPCLV